jgi:hypothetical protein
MTIDEIWDDATEKKFGGVVLPSEKKKGSRKRKLAADEEVEDGGTSIPPDKMKMASSVEGDPPAAAAAATETSTIQSQQHSKSSMLPLCGLEDDERMLSFLQANHGGDSDRAKFSIMVNSDRGYGEYSKINCVAFLYHAFVSSSHALCKSPPSLFSIENFQLSKGGDK